MKKLLFFLFLIISGSNLFAQLGTNSNFSPFTDIQKYDHWKIKNRDTSLLKESYQFDEKGILNKKIKIKYYGEPRELTVYSFDNLKFPITVSSFKETELENIFDSFENKCFYNKRGLLDSVVSTSSYPIFDYISVDKKNDSLANLKNIKEFDEPSLSVPPSSIFDETKTTTTINGKMVTGHTKVKKMIVLKRQETYIASKLIFHYNAKGQRINEFMDSDESKFSGNTFFTYDEKGRMKEICYYYQNSYKLKNGAKNDSIDKWKNLFRGDSIRAKEQTQKQINEELADTIIRYNAKFQYNNDGSTIETVVFPNRIYKLIYNRNQKGQIVKSILTELYVQNKYLNGRFIPTDTRLIADSLFSLYETTSIYQYDSLNRIIKIAHSFRENKKGKEKEDYCIFKYSDNRALILPESEYIDFIRENDYWSQQAWPYYH